MASKIDIRLPRRNFLAFGADRGFEGGGLVRVDSGSVEAEWDRDGSAKPGKSPPPPKKKSPFFEKLQCSWEKFGSAIDV